MSVTQITEQHPLTLDWDYLLKILLIGDSGVGKTSLLSKFADNFCPSQHVSTIGVDFKIRTVDVQGSKVAKLQLWDTAGQERFKAITASYYRGAHGVIIMYDCTSRESFNNCRRWIQEVRQLAPVCICVLVGNKTDCLPQSGGLPAEYVSPAEGKQLADAEEMAFIQTSATQSLNIHDVFNHLAHEIVEDYTRGVQAGEEDKSVYGVAAIERRNGKRAVVRPEAQQQEGGGICSMCSIM